MNVIVSTKGDRYTLDHLSVARNSIIQGFAPALPISIESRMETLQALQKIASNSVSQDPAVVVKSLQQTSLVLLAEALICREIAGDTRGGIPVKLAMMLISSQIRQRMLADLAKADIEDVKVSRQRSRFIIERAQNEIKNISPNLPLLDVVRTEEARESSQIEIAQHLQKTAQKTYSAMRSTFGLTAQAQLLEGAATVLIHDLAWARVFTNPSIYPGNELGAMYLLDYLEECNYPHDLDFASQEAMSALLELSYEVGIAVNSLGFLFED